MTISVVIPTWNEACWLPRLLRCLKDSEVDEIIVVDNNSSDNTVHIASEFGCSVLSGSRPSISRNIGAKAARGEILVFIDADVLVPEKIIERARYAIEHDNYMAVHFKVVPITDLAFVTITYRIMNFFFQVLSILGASQGLGNFIVVRRDAFEAVNGFHEKISVAEDVDFFRRINKLGRIKFETGHTVYVSSRRYYIENWALYCLKCLQWSVLRLCGLRASIVSYKWKGYPEALAQSEEDWIRRNIPMSSGRTAFRYYR
jgi:glycosyltransferase involved in cell wall biosynthesis